MDRYKLNDILILNIKKKKVKKKLELILELDFRTLVLAVFGAELGSLSDLGMEPTK